MHATLKNDSSNRLLHSVIDFMNFFMQVMLYCKKGKGN